VFYGQIGQLNKPGGLQCCGMGLPSMAKEEVIMALEVRVSSNDDDFLSEVPSQSALLCRSPT